MIKTRISDFLNLESFFVVLILVMGSLFVFLVPPNQVPDEGSHFGRVYGLLDSNFPKIPESLIELLSNGYKALPIHEPGQKISINSYIHELTLQNDRTNTVNIPYSTNYSPILYLPQLVGVAIGKALQLNNLGLFILGRLASLIVYICIGYWVLKTTPVAKRTLFVILTLPMAIFVAASYSADAVQIELTLIYLNCLMLGIGTQSPFSKKDWVIFLVLAMLLSLTKPVSLLVLLTSLAIPVSRFGNNNKKKLVFVIAQIVMGMFVAVWNFQGASEVSQYITNIWPLKQLAFIALNPLVFKDILIHTFLAYGSFYFQSFTGLFGWLTFALPNFAPFLLLITFFVAVFSEPKSAFSLSKGQKTLFALVFGLYVLGLEVIMYLMWTPVGNGIIEGVQGRYFIPIMPLLIYIVVGSLKMTLPFKRVSSIFIAILTTIVLTVSVQVIYLKYYVPCGEYFYDINGTCMLPIGLPAEKPIGEITKLVTQTFTVECNGIMGIDLFFGTYARQNSGSLNVSLRDETSNTVVFEKDIDVAKLKDNEWESFRFPLIQNVSGNKFALTLLPRGSAPRNAITVWSTASDIYTQGELLGVEGNGDLVFRYVCPYGIVNEIRNVYHNVFQK